MGSPYLTIESARVNVIRSERGYLQLLQSICNIAASDYLYDIALEFIVKTRLEGAKYHDRVLSGCDVHEFNSKASQALWVLISDSSFPWSNFSATVVDLTDSYLRATEEASRVAVLVATWYTSRESVDLDRVVIIDRTERSPLLK